MEWLYKWYPVEVEVPEHEFEDPTREWDNLPRSYVFVSTRVPENIDIMSILEEIDRVDYSHASHIERFEVIPFQTTWDENVESIAVACQIPGGETLYLVFSFERTSVSEYAVLIPFKGFVDF